MGRAGQTARAWELLEEMRGAGIHPNQFTCSALIKGLSMNCSSTQIWGTLDLLRDSDACLNATIRSTWYHAVLDAASHQTGGEALIEKTLAQMRFYNVAPKESA